MRVIGRLKDLGTFRGGLTYSTDDICDENQGVLVLRSSNIQNGKLDFQDNVYVNCYIAKDLFVKKGDILICSRNGSAALVGKTAMIDSNIKASWGAFMMLFSTKYNSAYMNYLLSISIGKNKGRFATSTINQLTNSMLGNILVEYENSLFEQNRIVAYLDEKTAAIDKQVSLLEQKKEKYTLLRKSIIKKAVTEGLKGETRDWKRMRGKDVYKISTGNLDANAEDENGTYPFFTCSSLPKRINKYSFDCEALLVAGNGQIGYTQYYNGKFDAYQRTYVLHNFKEISPLFLKYYVASMLPIFVAPRSVGSVISFIKYGDLAEFPIPVPPLFEQRAIADYLDEKCAKIDAIVANINQQIEKYKLLRRALINEVVTGQKII